VTDSDPSYDALDLKPKAKNLKAPVGLRHQLSGSDPLDDTLALIPKYKKSKVEAARAW
jgi:hypothetical protein